MCVPCFGAWVASSSAPPRASGFWDEGVAAAPSAPREAMGGTAPPSERPSAFLSSSSAARGGGSTESFLSIFPPGNETASIYFPDRVERALPCPICREPVAFGTERLATTEVLQQMRASMRTVGELCRDKAAAHQRHGNEDEARSFALLADEGTIASDSLLVQSFFAERVAQIRESMRTSKKNYASPPRPAAKPWQQDEQVDGSEEEQGPPKYAKLGRLLQSVQWQDVEDAAAPAAFSSSTEGNRSLSFCQRVERAMPAVVDLVCRRSACDMLLQGLRAARDHLHKVESTAHGLQHEGDVINPAWARGEAARARYPAVPPRAPQEMGANAAGGAGGNYSSSSPALSPAYSYAPLPDPAQRILWSSGNNRDDLQFLRTLDAHQAGLEEDEENPRPSRQNVLPRPSPRRVERPPAPRGGDNNLPRVSPLRKALRDIMCHPEIQLAVLTSVRRIDISEELSREQHQHSEIHQDDVVEIHDADHVVSSSMAKTSSPRPEQDDPSQNRPADTDETESVGSPFLGSRFHSQQHRHVNRGRRSLTTVDSLPPQATARYLRYWLRRSQLLMSDLDYTLSAAGVASNAVGLGERRAEHGRTIVADLLQRFQEEVTTDQQPASVTSSTQQEVRTTAFLSRLISWLEAAVEGEESRGTNISSSSSGASAAGVFVEPLERPGGPHSSSSLLPANDSAVPFFSPPGSDNPPTNSSAADHLHVHDAAHGKPKLVWTHQQRAAASAWLRILDEIESDNARHALRDGAAVVGFTPSTTGAFEADDELSEEDEEFLRMWGVEGIDFNVVTRRNAEIPMHRGDTGSGAGARAGDAPARESDGTQRGPASHRLHLPDFFRRSARARQPARNRDRGRSRMPEVSSHSHAAAAIAYILEQEDLENFLAPMTATARAEYHAQPLFLEDLMRLLYLEDEEAATTRPPRPPHTQSGGIGLLGRSQDAFIRPRTRTSSGVVRARRPLLTRENVREAVRRANERTPWHETFTRKLLLQVPLSTLVPLFFGIRHTACGGNWFGVSNESGAAAAGGCYAAVVACFVVLLIVMSIHVASLCVFPLLNRWWPKRLFTALRLLQMLEESNQSFVETSLTLVAPDLLLRLPPAGIRGSEDDALPAPRWSSWSQGQEAQRRNVFDVAPTTLGRRVTDDSPRPSVGRHHLASAAIPASTAREAPAEEGEGHVADNRNSTSIPRPPRTSTNWTTFTAEPIRGQATVNGTTSWLTSRGGGESRPTAFNNTRQEQQESVAGPQLPVSRSSREGTTRPLDTTTRRGLSHRGRGDELEPENLDEENIGKESLRLVRQFERYARFFPQLEGMSRRDFARFLRVSRRREAYFAWCDRDP